MGGEGLLLMILQHVLHVGYIILGSGKLWGGGGREGLYTAG